MSMKTRLERDHESNEGKLTWNDQIIESCAHFLRKSIGKLREEYKEKFNNDNISYPHHSSELLPRDFFDYVIITALKDNLYSNKRNLCAWYFNLMDRTGSGYVLKEEFIRYSPYMSPVSDEAISETIFSILLSMQEDNDDESLPQNSTSGNNGNTSSSNFDELERESNDRKENIEMLHKRRRKTLQRNNLIQSDTQTKSRKTSQDSYNLLPSAVALRYETWENYYESIINNYCTDDSEWVKVKEEIGIDSDEVLIKAENGIAHVDFLPALGKIYLSQRYLIFHAAIGINHYVARLGAVKTIRKSSIPFLLRDVFEVRLASETQAAIHGVTRSRNSMSRNGGRMKKETVPQHIEKIMKKFTNGDKPLMLSFMELGDSSKRDEWVIVLKEIICAHELHRKMRFGDSGRISRFSQTGIKVEEGMNRENEIRGSSTSRNTDISQYNQAYSPFQNEPLTPLLVVAAHVNVSRYKSFPLESIRKNPHKLLIFSYPQFHERKIKWFVDSVQKRDGWKQKSWIKRVLSAVRENIATNERLYNANDFKPVSIPILTSSIGRLAELCSPLANFVQNCNYLFQWKNPYATILAILLSGFIAMQGLIFYIPSGLILCLILLVIETNLNIFGLHEYGNSETDIREQQQNVFSMVAQVQDALQATQNVVLYVNKHLGKVQTLFLWRSNHRDSWIAVTILTVVMIVFTFVSARLIFTILVFFMFGKHFLPPSNPILRFWESVPSSVDPSQFQHDY